MSVESAKAFVGKLAEDAELRSKVEGAADDGARRQVAKDAGFDFTRDEMKQAAGQSKNRGELSEDELSSVAGGNASGWTAVALGAAAAAA